MSNYIIAYHGGNEPESPEEGAKHMAKWQAWVDGLGDAAVNPGTPLGKSRIVSASGVSDDGGPNPMSGYSIVEADSMDAALDPPGLARKPAARSVLRMLINQPFAVTEREGQYDVTCTVKGGGLSGQAGAVKHGISKALMFYEPGLRGALKKEGFLTRDSRVVERKKYGRRKARRSFQFSKR